MHRHLPRFFFFQAEDGIRDIGVTGVQTCALPISILGRHDGLAWTPRGRDPDRHGGDPAGLPQPAGQRGGGGAPPPRTLVLLAPPPARGGRTPGTRGVPGAPGPWHWWRPAGAPPPAP